jgi:hypothetical protein
LQLGWAEKAGHWSKQINGLISGIQTRVSQVDGLNNPLDVFN